MTFLEWLYLHNVILSLLFSPIFGLIFFGMPFLLIKKQKPRFFIRSRAIITNLTSEFGELEVSYRNNPIVNLTETRIFFWNAGRKSIRENDLLTATPIVVSIPSEIETYRISYISTPDLGKTIKIFEGRKGEYELSFEAMQKHDGVCVSVLHSGSEENTIIVNGKLDQRIKVRKAENTSSDPSDTSFINKTSYKIILSLILLCASMAVATYASINRLSLELLPRFFQFSSSPFMAEFGIEGNEFISLIILSIVLLFLAFVIFFNASNNIPNKLIYLSQKNNEYLPLYDVIKSKEIAAANRKAKK